MIGFRCSQLSSHLSAVGRKCGSLFHSHQQNVFVALFFSWRELEEMCRTLSSCQNVGKKFSLRFFSAGTWGNSKDPFLRQQRGIIYATQAVSTASTAAAAAAAAGTTAASSSSSVVVVDVVFPASVSGGGGSGANAIIVSDGERGIRRDESIQSTEAL